MTIQFVVLLGFQVGLCTGYCQGFLNLDFEQAQLVLDPGRGYYASFAIPGWTAYISGMPQQDIVYNNVPLGDPMVTLQGPGNPYPSVSGQYFMFLFGQYNPNHNATSTNSSAIGQTGQIPASARSLTFWGTYPTIDVTFQGQPLAFAVLRSTANYNVFGADISAFAGQTGELLFTAPYNTAAEIDNIQFSSQPIPEPGSFVLLGAGGLALVWRFRRQRP